MEGANQQASRQGSRRVIFVSRLMKGWEHARAIAEFKAQEAHDRTKFKEVGSFA